MSNEGLMVLMSVMAVFCCFLIMGTMVLAVVDEIYEKRRGRIMRKGVGTLGEMVEKQVKGEEKSFEVCLNGKMEMIEGDGFNGIEWTYQTDREERGEELVEVCYNKIVGGEEKVLKKGVIEEYFSGKEYEDGSICLIVPENIEEIESYAFEGCNYLGAVVMSNNVRSIGEGAFKECLHLRKCGLSVNIEELSKELFCGCSRLVGGLYVPNRVREIGEKAFYGCSGLTLIDGSGSKLERIGKKAFAFCDNLKDVMFYSPSNLKEIGREAFSHSGIEWFKIPVSVEKIGDYAFVGCRNLEKIIAPKNVNYFTEDGVLYSGDRSILLCYPSGKVGTDFILPNEVKEIETDAFHDNPYIVRLIKKSPYSKDTVIMRDNAVSDCANFIGIEEE